MQAQVSWRATALRSGVTPLLALLVGCASGAVQPHVSAPLEGLSGLANVVADGSRNDRCASYQGERLYASFPISLKSFHFFALPANARPGVKPLCTISYDGIAAVGGMAVDGGGKLWVMDSKGPTLNGFAHAANGSNAPSQIISGSNTLLVGLQSPTNQGVAADHSGNVWVPNWWGYNGLTGYVTAYANDAQGNIAPIATIGYGDKGKNESIAAPVAVTFDHEGNLYVAEYSLQGKVVVFSPPFTDTSRPVASWSIPDLAVYLGVDDHDNIYVASYQDTYVFKHGLKSRGKISATIELMQGDYDVKASPRGDLYVALVGYDPSHQVAIAVLPSHATSYDPKRYITSPYFGDGWGSLAVGR